MLHEKLSAWVPDQGPATVVHGDYRLDNVIMAPDGSEVLSVLDWELCTLGDPLADVGQLLVYWTELGEQSPLGHSGTAVEGFPSREEITDRYGHVTGRDLNGLGFYRRSRSGSSAAFWRAFTPATSAGRWATMGSTSASTPTRSPRWPRREGRPWRSWAAEKGRGRP